MATIFPWESHNLVQMYNEWRGLSWVPCTYNSLKIFWSIKRIFVIPKDVTISVSCFLSPGIFCLPHTWKQRSCGDDITLLLLSPPEGEAEVFQTISQGYPLKYFFDCLKIICPWGFPGGPMVKISPSNSRGVGSTLGQRAEIPHSSGPTPQKKPKCKTEAIL